MPVQAFDRQDRRRLARAIAEANGAAAAGMANLLPAAGPLGDAALRAACRFAHRAVLLFPTVLDAALVDFTDRGLFPQAPVPSVLVRRRLCARYGIGLKACDVSVTRLCTMPASGTPDLEVFLFPRTAGALEPAMVDAERRFGFEDHLAFEVPRPDAATLDRLVAILQHDAGLVFEGGGHNPHEGLSGSTVLYFVGRPGDRLERFELYCTGDFSGVVDRNPVDDDAVRRVYEAWSGTRPPSLTTAA